MKKLFTLLLVLTCCVGTASAWGDLYLICPQNNNWSNTSFSDNFKFTCLAENQYRATIPGSYVNTSQFNFRFRDRSSDTWQNISPESTENDAEISPNTTYSTNWQNSSVKCFYIPQNSNAKYVHIYCNWNTSTNKWDITCKYVEEQTTYNVAYTNPSEWSDVYVYSFLDGVVLTDAWPGTKIDLTDGVYKSTITGAPGSRVIFNKGESGDGNQSWTMDVEDDAVYKYDGRVSNQTLTLNTYGMATYCSAYPLDFSSVSPSGLTAYRISAAADGNLTKEALAKVPAGVGVYVEGAAGAEYTIPTTATATAIGTNMLVGVTSDTNINQVAGDNTNFILTVNAADGDVATPKFFKVNSEGNKVLANRAYLQIPTAYVNAREFFWFVDETEENETTGINAVNGTISNGAAIYNLAGQKVSNDYKGIVIVNGKKIIRK